MKKWYMVTVVGADRPGIVAHLSAALYEGGCNLGEASMMRLGGNFTIMMMVEYHDSARRLALLLEPVTDSMDLRLHIDAIRGKLHQHVEPDVRITIAGADRAGIVAHATATLAEAGLNILNLESDVAGSEAEPLYIMHIEGQAREGVAALAAALEIIRAEGVDASLAETDALLG